MRNGLLDRDGFCVLQAAVPVSTIARLLEVCTAVFNEDSQSVRARSFDKRASRGHVYAARNLIESIPEASMVWREEPLLSFLRQQLSDTGSGRGHETPAPGLVASSTTPTFGLVRALFFDKPPDRTWNLPWHKDTSIAVKDNHIESASFSRPTTKAGVPHLIACDEVLKEMLTLRIHLDEVTDENGPLRVIPGSHVASDSDGVGVDNALRSTPASATCWRCDR